MVGLGNVVPEDCLGSCFWTRPATNPPVLGFLDPCAGGLLQCLLDHLLHARSVPEPEEQGVHPRLQEGMLPLAPTKAKLQGCGDSTRINATVQQQGPEWNGFRAWGLHNCT